MATKNNPGKFDCYNNAEPDEPMFILLARDKHAPMLVRLWAEMRRLDGEDREKLSEALTCATQMEFYRQAREKLTKGRGGKIAPDEVHVSWGTHFTISIGSAVAKRIKWVVGHKVDIFIGTDDDLGQMQVIADPNGQYVVRKPPNSEVVQVQRSSLPHVTASKHTHEAVEFKYLEKGIHITDLPSWATPIRKPMAQSAMKVSPNKGGHNAGASQVTRRPPDPDPIHRDVEKLQSIKTSEDLKAAVVNRDVIASRTNTPRAPEEFLEATVSRRCIVPDCRSLFRTNLVAREKCGAHPD